MFNWQFSKDGPGRTEDIVMFSFPEKGLKGMGGNISKVKPGEHTTGPKTVKLYLYVEDLEKTMEVSEPSCHPCVSVGEVVFPSAFTLSTRVGVLTCI